MRAEEIFTKNDVIFANHPRWLYGKIFGCIDLQPPCLDAMVTIGATLDVLPRTMEIFSTQRLNEFHKIRADEGRLTIEKLFYECSSPVNLYTIFNELTLNVMMRMISGSSEVYHAIVGILVFGL
ncbi:cytochrome P450 [Artemisia annua]|uniref:Cytochrome P450 n=1 Tax=Artemisia annua TaxID=35608 RepID=A0A2U1Q253_ARTAN|nr:cytochrome P450 [Artemisia annua]